MARAFDDGSSQYLSYAGAVLSAEPIAMTAWFNSNDDAIIQNLVCIGDASSDRGWNLQARGNVAGDPVAWYVRGDTAQVAAQTSTGYSVSTWYHACGLSAADNDHRCWIDGGSAGSSSTDIGLASGLDRTEIGAHPNFSTHNKCMSGYIAEAGIYDLSAWPGATDTDKADEFVRVALPALALGISPRQIPLGLVAYWPLLRTDQDIAGGYDMTPVNAPTWADHPSAVRYPIYHIGRWAAAAGGPTLSIAITPTDSSYWVQGIKIVG